MDAFKDARFTHGEELWNRRGEGAGGGVVLLVGFEDEEFAILDGFRGVGVAHGAGGGGVGGTGFGFFGFEEKGGRTGLHEAAAGGAPSVEQVAAPSGPSAQVCEGGNQGSGSSHDAAPLSARMAPAARRTGDMAPARGGQPTKGCQSG